MNPAEVSMRQITLMTMPEVEDALVKVLVEQCELVALQKTGDRRRETETRYWTLRRLEAQLRARKAILSILAGVPPRPGSRAARLGARNEGHA